MSALGHRDVLNTLGTAAPFAAAILVFGTIYGAASRAPLGAPLALGSSALIFSGALQFALLGLLNAEAATLAILATGATLNLRHIILGAVLRPRLSKAVPRRALVSAFLIDESFGLAVAAEDAEKTLLLSGVLFYLAWVAGTAVGILGAGLSGLQEVAAAIFPVLFIGLAAITSPRLHHAARAVVAAVLTAVVAYLVPGVRGLAPLIAGIAVALPGKQE